MSKAASRELVAKLLAASYCTYCGAEEGLVLRSGTPEHERFVLCPHCEFHFTPNFFRDFYTWTLGKRKR